VDCPLGVAVAAAEARNDREKARARPLRNAAAMLRTNACRSLLLAVPLLVACGDASGTGGGTGGGGDGGAGATGAQSGATSGSGSAAQGTGSSSSGSGGENAGLVPVFVAQGHFGRLMVSCDDGQTWVHNQSADDTAECWSENNLPDCDHSPWAGRGLAFGNGAFVSTFGWGSPGVMRRSVDGGTWEDVWVEPPTFADIAFGQGVFVANASPTSISTDGATWQDGGDLGLNVGNVRAIEFVPHDGGLFIVTGESGDNRDIVLSPDGIAWHHPTTRPNECGSYVINVAYGAGTIAIFSGHGTVCTSTDGGDTWTLRDVAGSLSSPGVWTGSEFFVYDGATLHRSPDAVTWTAQPIEPPNIRIGAMARSDAGTFVATRGGWQVWYDGQEMYRSTDGVTWQVLPAGAFVPSHPINFIEAGFVEPSSVCPAP